MKLFCKKEELIETSDWFLKNYAECERKAFHANVIGIEPRDTPADSPLTIGSAYHEAMETVHAELQANAPATSWSKVVDEHFGGCLARFEGGSDHDRDVWGATFHCWLTAMIRGYLAHRIEAPWAESHAETWFRQPVEHPLTGDRINGVTHKGAIDLLVRADRPFVWGDAKYRLPAECAGGWYIKECKTAAKVDDPYVGRLIADDQITMYAHYLGKERSIPIEGVLYDVTIKPPKKTVLVPDESDLKFARRKARTDKDAASGKLGKRLRLKIGESADQLRERRVAKGLEEVKALKRIKRTSIPAFIGKLTAYYANPERFVRVFVPLQPQITRAKLEDQYFRIQRIKESVDIVEIRIANADHEFIRTWGACWPQKGRCEFWPICSSSNPQSVIDESFVRRTAQKTAKRHVVKEIIASAPDADEML